MGEKFVTLMTRKLKKTLATPIVLRIAQLNSKKTGFGAMMVDRAALAPLDQLV
jgi:hypothetical protein